MSVFTESDITQHMIQAGRHAANLPDGTLARIYLSMRAAERGWDTNGPTDEQVEAACKAYHGKGAWRHKKEAWDVTAEREAIRRAIKAAGVEP